MVRALPGSGHRLYLLDRKTVALLGSPSGPMEEFVVLGATGNVYTVTLSRQPTCTCPDAAKGNLCKHQLFVMLRILRLDAKDPLVWQRAFLTPEIEEILGGTRSTRADETAIAQESLRAHYRRMSGQGPSTDDGGEGEQQPGQRAVEGDCPICYDELKAGSSAAADKIVWCATCGNNVHAECFRRWTAAKQASHTPVSCVYCRATPWIDGSNPQGGAAPEDDSGYVNLKAVSEHHRNADSSLEALYGDRARWIGRGGGRSYY
ncbi:hypothetical protein WJX72_002022 [[Myrmecia] bisecta]|uniref:SWIM-type domain-containing protein n=1 Tax=[Myrmecia] bisecta TaxID=41462 RepID=A0AAW1QP84_9CHLO